MQNHNMILVISVIIIILTRLHNYTDAFTLLSKSSPRTCSAQKQSSVKDLFGFSLEVQESTGQIKLLVGAPKTFHHSTSLRDGTVYSCILDTSDCSCDELNLTKSHGSLKSDDASDPQNTDVGFLINFGSDSEFQTSTNNSLMGYSITVEPKSGIMAACAPLHYFAEGTVGSCVGLNSDLKETLFRSYFMVPISRVIRSSGASANLVKNYNTNRYTLFAGAPLDNQDTFVSSGNAYSVSFSNSSYYFTDTLDVKKMHASDLFKGRISSYAGYAMDKGFYRMPRTIASQPDIIISAPRFGDHRGSIFTIYNDMSSLIPHIIAEGDSKDMGSYFGYSILAINFNDSDDCDDLIVGSPLFSTFSPLLPDRGQITLFIGEPSSDGQTCNLSKRSEHYGDINARFGSSIKSIGDLNKDGVPDIAVSSLNSNKIRIFMGIKNGKLFESEMIDITNYNITKAFSMIGGYDFNKDQFPDLAFSSIESEVVKIIPGSPLVRVDATLDIINIEGKLISETEAIDVSRPRCNSPKEGSGIKVLCFNVRPCFNMTSVVPGQVKKFKINFTVTLSNFNINLTQQRAYFVESTEFKFVQEDDETSGEYFISLEENKKLCTDTNYTVYFYSNIGDISPVVIELILRDVDQNQIGIIKDNIFEYIYPTLDITKVMITKAPFALRQVNLDHPCSDSLCNVDLILKIEPITTWIVSEGIYEIVLYVSNNETDVSIQTIYTATFPDYVEVIQRFVTPTEMYGLTGTDSQCGVSSQNQSCYLQPNPFPYTQNLMDVKIAYRLKLSLDIPLTTESLQFNFNINSSEAKDLQIKNNIAGIFVKLNTSAELVFVARANMNRVTLVESENKTVGPYETIRLSMSYRIGNYGPTWVNSANLTLYIFWPFCIREFCSMMDAADQLLIFIRTLTSNPSEMTCSPLISSLNTTNNSISDLLTRMPNFTNRSDAMALNTYKLCNETAYCMQLECNLYQLRLNKTAAVTIASEIIVGRKVDIHNLVRLQPSAYLNIPNIPIITFRPMKNFVSNSISSSIYIFPQATLTACLLLFPIVAGVIAGIALLFILGMILWCVHFTRKETYVLLKTKKKGSRSNTPSTGPYQVTQSPKHGQETSAV